MFLRNELPTLAKHARICFKHDCKYEDEEHWFPGQLASKIKDSIRFSWFSYAALWPPEDSELGLREVLEQTCSVEHIELFGSTNGEHEVKVDQLRDLCREVSHIASGLCIEYLRVQPMFAAVCQHAIWRAYCTDNDPIFPESAARFE